MRKSREQLESKRIVAVMLRELKPEEMLHKARTIATEYKFAIAERVTIAIMLANMWDEWEDFDEAAMNNLYERYLDYHMSFRNGNEQIFHQILQVNQILNGELLEGKMLSAVMEESLKEGIKADLNLNKEEGT